MATHPQAEPSPFSLQAGSVGALLVHGFTGSPAEMRPIGDYLYERGFSVLAPLLPGHGTTPEDLDQRRWEEWTACVEEALTELGARCDALFVGGLSMGALLTLWLAAHHPELRGAMVYSPALLIGDRRALLAPLVKHVIRWMPKGGHSMVDPGARPRCWGYDVWPVAGIHELSKLGRQVKGDLAKVRCPLLVVHSTRDRHIHPRSAQATHDGVSSRDKEIVTLHDSGHCLTADGEWEDVAERTYRFILQHLLRAGAGAFAPVASSASTLTDTA